jgi:hypothetical protein
MDRSIIVDNNGYDFSRSHTPVRSYTKGEDEDVRMQNLEEMVAQREMLAQFVRQGSRGSESRPTVVRVSVKSDCIPEFIPGQPNQISATWVDKLDQLARVNRLNENTTVQLMQNHLTGLRP